MIDQKGQKALKEIQRIKDFVRIIMVAGIMKKKRSVHELEMSAVASAPLQHEAAPHSEAVAMLVRRGLRPEISARDVPFPQPFCGEEADRFAGWLRHYAFRLFLRGAIRKSPGFLPADTTRSLTKSQSGSYAETMVALGLAENIGKAVAAGFFALSPQERCHRF